MVYECNMNKTDVVWIEDQKEEKWKYQVLSLKNFFQGMDLKVYHLLIDSKALRTL